MSVDFRAPALSVEATASQQCLFGKVLVRNGHHKGRQGGVDQVEDGQIDSINRVGR